MRRSVVLLAVLAWMLSGCSQPSGDTAFPVPSAPAPSASAPTSSAIETPARPPRPRNVPLDGLDPCALLPEADRLALGLEQPPIVDVRISGFYGGETRLCSVRGFEPRVISVGVELVESGGIELFYRPGTRYDITPVEVAGFPAIIARSMIFDDTCLVAVDVADGQLVDVSARSAGGVPPIPQAELCGDAERIAGVATENLLALR